MYCLLVDYTRGYIVLYCAVFSVNYDSHYQQRQFLAAMLVAKDSEDIHLCALQLCIVLYVHYSML